MTGMAASRELFRRRGLPMLERRFPDLIHRVAAGLVGEGSECFGFDDDLSHDHDWQPGFCLWLNDDDFNTASTAVQRAYVEALHPMRNCSAPDGEASTRRGVFATGAFFFRFLNRSTPPETNADWLKLPEEYLAVCTNGEIFHDPLGEFSDFRSKLLDFYPQDIRLKRIVARCVTLAQDGQYNYPRCLERNETVAANHALARFIHAACSLVHLLHRRYKPFYKWMHRSLGRLPAPGPEVADHLDRLADPQGEAGQGSRDERRDRVETVAEILVRTMRRMDVSDSSSGFLLKHAVVIRERIADPTVRRLPLGSG